MTDDMYWALLHGCCAKVAKITGEDFQTVVNGAYSISQGLKVPPHRGLWHYFEGWKKVVVFARNHSQEAIH